MAYTPPGVYTQIEIQNNIVSLPGGTRVLAIIGMGRNYKCVSGEAVVQTSDYNETLAYTSTKSVSNVYDFTNPGGGLKYYPLSGSTTSPVSVYGEGYTVTNGVISWSPAANAYPTSTVALTGSTYYVSFSGSYGATGTTTLVSNSGIVQTSAYSNNFSPYSGVAIVSVSGNGLLMSSGNGSSWHPAGPDSSGYTTLGAGWDLTSSGTILWTAVTGSYAYPSASVPPVDGIYYVDYCYYKSGSDYNPKFFTDYTQVVNEYGPEAEWTLVTSGTNAGSYNFANLNTLTLAARLAFANGAAIINLTQISGSVFTNNSVFQTPLNRLQNKLVDIIVPITAGSGATTTEMSVSEKAALLLDVETHCDTMSLPQNKKERVAIGSLGVAEIGNTTDVDTYVYTANSIENKRITITAPGLTTVEIQDPNGEFQDIQVEGSFMSVAMAALSCNPNSDVATPLTNKNLSNFASTSAVTAEHDDPEYLESEKNILAAGGICVIDRNGARISIRHQLTTNQTNVAEGEFSVVTTTDYVSQAVRFTTEQFIGRKLVSAIVVPAVRATIQATMQALTDAQLINSIGAITVSINPNNPTEILSTVQYVPIFPLNRIKITFTIRTQI
jgi:hypothetical protein